MQIRHVKTLLQYQDGAAKVTGLAWSPNNMKLAAATADRVIILFDENGEKKDKFSTKPGDAKAGKKTYSIKGISFSPDSTKLAVGQTDNIIFVYKIGTDWGDKKVICNKFGLSSSVTCLVWPVKGPLIIGLADGRVRAAHIKTNKSNTLFSTDSVVESLAVNQGGTGFISGHADGTIIRYYVAEDGSALPQGKVAVHGVIPTVLAWAGSHIIVSGCDQRVCCYGADGRIAQQIELSNPDDREINVAVSSACGQMVVLGSFDKIRLVSYNPRKRLWEETANKEIRNLYTVTSLAWRSDSLYLVTASLCGGVELFESVARRTSWNGKVEIVYISSSQAVVKCSTDDNSFKFSPVVFRTKPGLKIDTLRIMGNGRYAIGRTERTLLIGDLFRGLVSEVNWSLPEETKVKYYFDTPNACMIFAGGELAVVEYGVNKILDRLRMEYMNPHLISLRINERQWKGSSNVKRLAYLLDLKTICISDLATGQSLGQVSHESKIDWLEMNETGRKLLYRDQKLRLYIVDIENLSKNFLLGACTFVEWVPGSDVIVAQSQSLYVWYHLESLDKVQTVEIRGEVSEILREPTGTIVRIQDGDLTTDLPLDDHMIEFGTAVEDGDLLRALCYLEKLESKKNSPVGLWGTLAAVSLKNGELRVAERCYAALGDVPKVRFLRETINMVEEISRSTDTDGMSSVAAQARIAILNRDLKLAERLYVDQGRPEAAVSMYRTLFQWQDAVRVADHYVLGERHQLRQDYLKWLQNNYQEAIAAEVYEENGDYDAAIALYLKAGVAAKAASVLEGRQELLSNEELVSQVLDVLEKNHQYTVIAEVYQAKGQRERSLDYYVKGHAFTKAVEIARRYFPARVTDLEQSWGDHLMSAYKPESAVQHYIEAGKMNQALSAAIDAQQWDKAADILEVLGESNVAVEYCKKLGQHFINLKNYEKAEKFLTKAQLYEETISMYLAVGEWNRAHRIAVQHLPAERLAQLLTSQGEKLEKNSRIQDAELLYVAWGFVDSAVQMRRRLKQYDHVIRLVKLHKPQQLQSVHLELARQLMNEGNNRASENHFIAAGEWKAAVQMYKESDQWEDAFRVVKANGREKDVCEFALEWVSILGPEVGGRFLQRQSILEECIDLACDRELFDLATNITRSILPSKLPDVFRRLASHLQTNSRFNEAEEAYIQADLTREAVLMYIRNEDWESAERVAGAHDPAALLEVLIAQSQSALKAQDFVLFESLLLRAQKPDLLINGYKENSKWQDAIRIARDYLPSKLQSLQDEYDKYMMKSQGSGVNSLMNQARHWEMQGEYARAVEFYFKVTPEMINDNSKLAAVWSKASELAVKFLDETKAYTLVGSAAKKLKDLGQHAAAAQLFLVIDSVREAVEALVEASDWQRARKIAQELDPAYSPKVEEAYRIWLRDQGNAEQLADVDLGGALELLVQQGQWDQCLDKAKQQGVELLQKYVAIYATQLLKEQRTLTALQVLVQHGAPAKPQNLNIYRHLASDLLHKGEHPFSVWAGLRNVFHQLVKELNLNPSLANPTIQEEFENYLWLFHYCAAAKAFELVEELQLVSAKISITLLRYASLVPADRAFYEAGMKAKAAGWNSLGFVLLNRFLDLADLIEDDGDISLLDNTDFDNTDIPFESLMITNRLSVSEADRESAKEWILAISLDQNVGQQLPFDERGIFEGSLGNGKGSEKAQPCVLSGYPVLKNAVRFPAAGKSANREDWNRFLLVTKRRVQNNELQDVLAFIEMWCEGLPSAASQFAF